MSKDSSERVWLDGLKFKPEIFALWTNKKIRFYRETILGYQIMAEMVTMQFLFNPGQRLVLSEKLWDNVLHLMNANIHINSVFPT